MKELLLDAETLYTREQLHDVLAKVCGFPADYGRNLDALYDLLTSMKSDAIQDELYAAGAALDHNLNSAAMNTYSASKIKKNV